MIKLMMPDCKGERSEEFKLAVVETELQQKLGASEFIASIFSWGTFDGKRIRLLMRRHTLRSSYELTTLSFTVGIFLWVLMEFCEHGSLTSYIKQSFDPALRDDWINQLSLGLQHMHSLSVIHRDIKPVRYFGHRHA